MRFEENVGVFNPFKIIVETQEEANFLCALVGATTQEVDDAFGVDSGSLFKYLEGKVKDVYDLPNITLDVDRDE